MIKQNIGIIYGGKSAEHSVSLLTAKSIINAINKEKYNVFPIFISLNGEWARGEKIISEIKDHKELIFSNFDNDISGLLFEDNHKFDIVFPVLHGPNGEDGTIQGLFEILDLPYVGCGVLASANGMDKIASKHLFQQAGIPQVPFVPFVKADFKKSPEAIYNRIEGTLRYPVFVKPANMGSSVGISKATNREELTTAIEEALKYDRRIVVEQGIDAREVEVAVLGNDEVNTSVVGEVVKQAGFYDYNEKYINNTTTLQIPAAIPEEVSTKIREYAETAFRAIDGSGLTRCDFFLTETQEVFINEVNTMPGFTQFSMYPKLWEAMGISYKDLVEELIRLALKRYNDRHAE